MYYCDDWPRKADGDKYGYDEMIAFLSSGGNPFKGQWDIQQLTNEVEQHVNTRVVGIQHITNGANSYGIHLRTSDGRDLLCRLARGDVNMPDWEGFTVKEQVNEVRFEAAVYSLLKGNLDIRASRLLYFRVPVQHPGTKTAPPVDLSG